MIFLGFRAFWGIVAPSPARGGAGWGTKLTFCLQANPYLYKIRLMNNGERKQAKILGFGVDLMTFDGALEFSEERLKQGSGFQVVTINPEMIEIAKKNPDFAAVLNNADLVIPDGVGIKLALKINGINQQNIPGIEYSKKLIAICAKNGFPIALLGAKEEIVQKAKTNLLKEFENLNIVYARNGYFSKEDEENIKSEMTQAAPKAVFVALGAPKQEFMIQELKKSMPEAVFVGVGGSFDVWSGVVKRAPEIYQKLGLEWLYRTVKEPQRFKRIFPALPLFLIRVIIDSVLQKKGY